MRAILVPALALGACAFQVDGVPPLQGGDDLAIPDGAAGPDVAQATDLAMPDLAMGDAAPVADLAMPDLRMADLAMPDLARPDLARPDLAMPDLAMPDLTTPDLAMADATTLPDLAMPDLATPDLATPDLATPDLMLPPPTLSTATPASGPTTGGVTITLDGANFASGPGLAVTFDGKAATNVSFVNATRLTAKLPADPGALGFVNVVVTNPDGQKAMRNDIFAYYSGTVTFTTPASTSTGSGSDPRGIVAGDVNGDKFIDLVVADHAAGGMRYALNDGKGDFASSTQVGSGFTNSLDVALADFNTDGFTDVVMVFAGAGQNPGGWVLFLNNANSGFAQQKILGQSVYWLDNNLAGGQAVRTGDLDGDGHADVIIAANATNNIFAAFGKGDGTFRVTSTTVDLGGHGAGLVVDDLNGDAKLDALASVNDKNRLAAAIGDGTGNLATPLDYTTAGGPTGVDVGFFDRDTKIDAVTACPGPNAVSVLLAADTTTHHEFTTGNGPVDVAVADFDGDGLVDLVTANGGGNSVSFLRGNGDGTFGTHVDFMTGMMPAGVTTADLDGDGRPDVALTVKGDIQVLLNRSQ